LKILIASSEAVPFVKTGGLADVAGSLLKELRAKKEEASLILPLYSAIKTKYKLYSTGKSILVKMGSAAYRGNIFASSKGDNPEAYFIECDELYGRPELYGTPAGDYPDNALRFIFFSRAVLEACIAMRIKPDVVHCNDWQTAMIPLYLKTLYKGLTSFSKTSTLFTVHNLGYQGIFDATALLYTGLGKEYFIPDRLEFYGKLNLMKAGLLYADLLNTVSVTYAREIQQVDYGFGLDGVTRKRAADLYGIINGIDHAEWDPSRDPFIPSRYGPTDLKGKTLCRKTLCREAALDTPALPIVSLIGRFSSQKGIELVLGSMETLTAMGVNLVVLGKGDEKYQRLMKNAAGVYKGRIFVRVGFEERMAHLIYAGSDFFLMPSHYEPCGLGQLIAMKYGTVPIARNTGGLADTIEDYDHISHTGTGFLFRDYSPYAMQDAVKRGLCVFTNKAKMQKLISSIMGKDFSWSRSADNYLKLYRAADRKAGK
jgi:starch synthase